RETGDAGKTQRVPQKERTMTDFLQIGPMRCQSGMWNNPKISINGGSFNVGIPSQISVDVQNSATQPIRLDEVQVVVCAAITGQGFMPASIVPSMVTPNGNGVIWQTPGGLQIPAGASQAVPISWTPLSNDMSAFEGVAGAMWELTGTFEGILHACVFVSCSGTVLSTGLK